MSLRRLISAFPGIDHRVIVLGAPGPLSPSVEAVADEIVHLDCARGIVPAQGAVRMAALAASMRADRLHGWMYHGCCAAMICRASSPRARVIWGVRQSLASLEHEPPLTRMVIKASRILARKADHIVYNSAAAQIDHERLGYPRAKGSVIPNGYDTRHYRPDPGLRSAFRARVGLPQDAIVVGLAARFHPMKDHATFFAAVRIAAQRLPDLRWVVAGEGCHPSHPAFAPLVPAELVDRIAFVGRWEEMSSFHAGIDVVTSSSAWGEAFSNVLAEGMAAGAVPVATDVGDSALIVGDCGVVVPPRAASELAEAWLRFAATGRDALARLGLRARARICERFDIATVANAYRSLYSASELACAAS